MVYVILSIFCSVTVGILLKLAKKKGYSFYQIININYFVAWVMTILLYEPKLKNDLSFSTTSIVLSLCLLLPIVFIFQAKAITYSGIVKTDIAQRMSLFLPLFFSFFILKETFNNYKWIGVILAFMAIFLSFYRKKNTENETNKKWYFLLLVLLGFGSIDILFKQVASLKELQFKEILYLVFPGAFLISFFISGYYLIKQKETFNKQVISWGIGVGLLNFGNISLYIKAHQALSTSPSTVFASMNMGVIILGSLVGILIFKENMNRWNYLGIVLSLLAIGLITYSLVAK